MKADPCLNPRCMALNVRADGAPMPLHCPRCGGPVLKPPPLRLGQLAARIALTRAQEGRG